MYKLFKDNSSIAQKNYHLAKGRAVNSREILEALYLVVKHFPLDLSSLFVFLTFVNNAHHQVNFP